MIKTNQSTIYPWHCDHMGHMNVKFYIEKFDEANFQLFALLGLNWKYFQNTHFGMAALEQKIHYKKEVFTGENIYIESMVVDLKQKIMRNRHIMRKSETGKVVATCDLICVHLDRNLHKSCKFPEFVHEEYISLNSEYSNGD